MAKKVIKMLLTMLMFLLIINIFEMNHTKSYAVLGDGLGLQFEMEIMHEEGAGSASSQSGAGITNIPTLIYDISKGMLD